MIIKDDSNIYYDDYIYIEIFNNYCTFLINSHWKYFVNSARTCINYRSMHNYIQNRKKKQKKNNWNKLYLMLVCNYRSKCNPEHRLKVHKRFIQLTTYPRDSIGSYRRAEREKHIKRETNTHTHTHTEQVRASEWARETVCTWLS